MRRGAPASLVIAGGGGGGMLLKISSKLRLSAASLEASTKNNTRHMWALHDRCNMNETVVSTQVQVAPHPSDRLL